MPNALFDAFPLPSASLLESVAEHVSCGFLHKADPDSKIGHVSHLQHVRICVFNSLQRFVLQWTTSFQSVITGISFLGVNK